MSNALCKRLREAQKLLLPKTKRHFGAMTFDRETKSLLSKDGKDRLKSYSKDEVSFDGRVIQSSIGSVVIESVPDN